MAFILKLNGMQLNTNIFLTIILSNANRPLIYANCKFVVTFGIFILLVVPRTNSVEERRNIKPKWSSTHLATTSGILPPFSPACVTLTRSISRLMTSRVRWDLVHGRSTRFNWTWRSFQNTQELMKSCICRTANGSC